MPKLTKIYTRKGDEGKTSLGGGQRVEKNHKRVRAFGTVDELNAQIGAALAAGLAEPLADELTTIQNELFNLGADLSFLEEDKEKFRLPQIEARHIEKLERLIDEYNETTGPLENFILPGGTPAAAALHIARTVCRRAERDVLALARDESIGEFVLPYINRLSDALFMMARYENFSKDVAEPLWDSKA